MSFLSKVLNEATNCCHHIPLPVDIAIAFKKTKKNVAIHASWTQECHQDLDISPSKRSFLALSWFWSVEKETAQNQTRNTTYAPTAPFISYSTQKSEQKGGTMGGCSIL